MSRGPDDDGRGRKSRRRRRMSENERICCTDRQPRPRTRQRIAYLVGRRRRELGQGQDVHLRRLREPLVDDLLRAANGEQKHGAGARATHFARMSLSPRTKLERICVSSAETCWGTLMSIVMVKLKFGRYTPLVHQRP